MVRNAGFEDIMNPDEVSRQIQDVIGDEDVDEVRVFGSVAEGRADLRPDDPASDLDVFAVDEDRSRKSAPLSGIDEFGMGFDETVEVETEEGRTEVTLDLLTGGKDDFKEVSREEHSLRLF